MAGGNETEPMLTDVHSFGHLTYNEKLVISKRFMQVSSTGS